MKTQKILGLLALSALTILPFSSQASDIEFASNIGFVTDYSFRGISQSDEGPAVQGGFDVSHSSGVYAGVWGSNVDFNDSSEATLEADLYAGYSNSLDNGITYDVGAIYYAYPGADDSLNYDFWEASLALGYDFDLLSVSTSVNYSPEFFGETGDAQYYALSVDVPLPSDLSLSAHIGHQDIDEGTDYNDWSVGLGYNYADLDFSLQYVETDLDEPVECVDGCGTRVIFGVSKSF
jgi:uncharacterized protein (TIGR02001 family)